ncbi:hypothetical protein FHR32_007934 [Streptosporangium album]|uniref:Uncharacterized protein n=1 Tax=Streptosporangium album TaxID=47479 RepID=A0A7W7S428_9ACTN|nr:hypothetical protein [Streptosporangium album]MBB4943534.1 hypothetical protein [Streptosporangium album]
MLRKAGRKEFGVGGGFAVESGGGVNPFLVACAGDPEQAAAELPQYEAALRKAGFRVELEPDDDQALQMCGHRRREHGPRSAGLVSGGPAVFGDELGQGLVELVDAVGGGAGGGCRW